jgi:hypothetical protein
MNATLDDELAELRRVNSELQQRLDEALDREAATAEALQVVNNGLLANEELSRHAGRSRRHLRLGHWHQCALGLSAFD